MYAKNFALLNFFSYFFSSYYQRMDNDIMWVWLTIRCICLYMQRLSEICCSAVSQLLMLAKSVISNANKAQDEDVDEDMLHMDWPEDSIEKAKIIRTRAQSMTGNVEAVCNSFITGTFIQHYFILCCKL